MQAKVLVLAAVVVCVGACERRSSAPASAAVASVSGQPISQELFDYYVTQKTGGAADKVDLALKASLLQELEELKAAAVEEEAKASADTREALELQRIEFLARAGATAAGVYTPPSDAELQAEYDRFVATLTSKEFHVAHILVATESTAQALILKLNTGADFGKLAREQSADDSNTRGGDLGWIAPGKLPVDFTNAVQALNLGQITAHPVHTIYGWHVIKLLEVRPAATPSFEQVKAQIAANLQQSRYKQFLQSAAANAKIDNGS